MSIYESGECRRFFCGGQKIIAELSEDTKKVELNVIDYEIDTDKNHIPGIFERFYRVSGAKEETFPARVIGLFISEQISEKHRQRLCGACQK